LLLDTQARQGPFERAATDLLLCNFIVVVIEIIAVCLNTTFHVVLLDYGSAVVSAFGQKWEKSITN
jgi:hypothetical protein